MREPWLDDGDVRVWLGDAREALRNLPDESVQCIVTSPPFWGLRDYGHEDQIGSEPTPEEWVANLVVVMRECRRVLRRDGTCWVEVGDSYKDGELVGAPWMLAFALRADGWRLRSENIWWKPDPMPESVTDRTTRAHSQVFMLTREKRYFYDRDAIAEAAQDWSKGGPGTGILTTEHYGAENGGNAGLADLAARYKAGDAPATRNARSVWRIATANTKSEHFAVMPDELAEKCISAGTSEHGACAECGAPWRRVVEKGEPELRAWSANGAAAYDDAEGGMVPRSLGTGSTLKHVVPRETTGWVPTCEHEGAAVVPQVVLDPFLGSGTTAFVARRMGRHAVGVELNESYLRIARERLGQQSLLT